MNYTGTSGNDDLTGTSGSDYFDMSQGGDDTVHAGAGNDVIVGGSGNDTFYGEAGDDQIYGGDGTNRLYGGTGNDLITNSGSGSTLSGGDGNDTFVDAGAGSTITGGGGDDTLTLERQDLSEDVTMIFRHGTGSTLPDGTSFTGIEHLVLYTGSGNDSVTFVSPVGSNSWDAGDGSDIATVNLATDHTNDQAGLGLDGTYAVAGASGIVTFNSVENFHLIGGFGNDNFQTLADGNDMLIGNSGDDTLTAGAGTDVLIGGNGDDVLADDGTKSSLAGGAGNDLIVFSGTDSKLSGGTGDDTLDLSWSHGSEPISIIFRPGSGTSIPDGTIIESVEHLNLSTGVADDQATFVSPIGINSWSDSGGDDTATVDFFVALAAVTTSVDNNGHYIVSSGANEVVFSGVENFDLIGGTGDDNMALLSAGHGTLTGNAGDDVLTGSAGSDIIDGGTGDDWIRGATGSDQIIGGKGADTIVYDSASESDGTAFDTVSGFDMLQDKFDLWFTVAALDHPLSGDLANLQTIADPQHLGAHDALLFSATDGHTYLVVDADGNAGYQNGQDILIRLDATAHLHALSTSTFI